MSTGPDFDLDAYCRRISYNGASERRVLQTESELSDALTGLFGLTLPDDPDLNAALTRMTIGAV